MAQELTKDLANGSKTPSVQDLSRQLDALKADVSSLTKTLADYGSSQRDQLTRRAKAQARDLQGRAHELGRDAQARADEFYTEAEEMVRRQPAAAVGVAAGVGFLVGLIASRR